MDDNLHAALHNVFGFAIFRQGQEGAIRSVLAGRHTLVVMPTGAGKSLIYQLAALCLPGVALVISPLIALMKDQVDGLNARGVAATFINSSLDSREQRRRLEALAAGGVKIAYVAPERLRSAAFATALRSAQVSLLAVDEAHCLSQWGHDFRPDYLHIAEARRAMGDPVTVALTATATPEVQDDIVRLLGLPRAEHIVTGFNRPNLTFEVRYTRDLEAKLAALRDVLLSAERACPEVPPERARGLAEGACPEPVEGAGIVYVGTRRDAEEVAEFARAVCGIEALYYHAGLDADIRTQAQEAFIAGDIPLIVATNAFGMGVDRPDVRFVLHYSLPGSLEAYYQEAGRAGRDGLPARCTLLYAPQDRALQEWFIENDAPSLEEVQALYAAIQAGAAGDIAMVTLDTLSLATGLHEVKVRVGLAQLEAAGALYRMGDAGARMHIGLGTLDEAGLQAASGQVEARREHKRRQLAKMIAYAEMNDCRRRAILAHFGDKGEAEAELCCDNCLAREQVVEQAAGQPDEIEPAERAAMVVLDTVRRLRWRVGQLKLAQVLKGSRAKDMIRFGYDKLVYYGRFAEMPLDELRGWVDQLIEAGYLKVVGGERPLVQLTPQGESAIKARRAIPLQLSRKIQPRVAARKKAEREAGGTVALTGQLSAQGLSPAQIAARRGLTEGTIYSHLAQLIAQGEVDVSAVVPEQVQAQIRAAIERCGGGERLAPIKALLPAHVTYGEIRCVAEAWKYEEGAPSQPISPLLAERIQRIVQLGEARSLSGLPELIAALEDPDGNVRRLAASALGKIGDRSAVEPLMALLARETKPQVRQYAVKALGKTGDARAHPLLEKIASDQAERDYTRKAAQVALRQSSTQPATDDIDGRDSIAAFLARSHPRPLHGPWAAGWALDFHSRFSGADWSRSRIGELAYRYKYGGQRALAETLADRLAALVAGHPELAQATAIVPVPPSSPRAFDPVSALCDALARRLNQPVQRALIKTRVTAPQKEMRTLAQKRANVAGAFAVVPDIVPGLRGKWVLVIDDLYDSGATLEEVTRTLQRAGVSMVVVLTLTRTIHADA